MFHIAEYNHVNTFCLCSTEMKKPYERNVDAYVVIFLLLALLISSLALANKHSPEMKVKFVFGQIESSLLALKSKNEFTKVNIKIELTRYLLPEVDTQFFSKKVLNKNLQKVPVELRDEFVTELSMQLINTYSNLLTKYNNEAIEISNATLSKSEKIAMVKLTIVGKNNSNKAVVKLLKSSDENWKFFDIVVEGISLIDSKHAEINASFNKLGAEATLHRIKERNIRSNSTSQ